MNPHQPLFRTTLPADELARALFEEVGDGYLLIDTSTHRIIDANAVTLRITGFLFEQIVGQSVTEMLRSEHADGEWLTALQQTRSFHGKAGYWLKAAGDTWVPVSVTIARLHLAQRQTVGLFAVRDQRDVVRLSGKLARAESELRELLTALSEGAYSALLDPRGVWSYLYLSPVLESLTGVRLAQWQVGPGVLLPQVHPDDQAAYRAFVAQLRHGQPGSLEYRIRRPNQVECWLAERVQARPQTQGKGTRLFGLVSDITSAKLAAQERQELERRYHLAQQHESVAVLAAGVAHEFNNLLLPVVANVDLVAAKLPPTAPERAWLLEARQAALRAAELTQQLLAHSGQGRVVVGPVDLVAFVQEQQTAWAAQVAPPAQWRVRYPAHPLTVNADATQLAQALTNLIANAVEALPEGQGTVTLALDGEYVPDPTALDWRAPDVPAGWYAFVEVSDTGGGIDAETLPRIFEPYFSTKFTGRGLGLAAVTGIVRGHNGLLNVRSRVGHGTAVRLYLLTTTVQPALPPPPSQRGQTILVTDDEDMVRLVVERILQAHGYTTLSAVDGQAALEVFDQTGTDIGLVLLDMTMPRLAGPETLAELRRRVPELPVIVMSGYSEQELTERFAGQSVPRFLKKPFTPTLLLAAVRAALPVTPSPR